MRKELFTKKKIFFFILLFFVFLSINSKWFWQMMYPIKYEKEIAKIAPQYQMNPYLILAIIQVETRFNEERISEKGALGPMQLMPETAEWIIEQGRFSSHFMDYLSRPEVNIALGSWYLSTIYRQFNQNLIATIAAYNAGPGNVNKWISQNIWDGTLENITQIPYGETRHYIQRVLFFYNRYKWIYEGEFSST